jgi:hypothetical protein
MGDGEAEINSEYTQPHYTLCPNDSVATYHFLAFLYGTSKTRAKQLIPPNDHTEAVMCTGVFTKHIDWVCVLALL